LLRARYSFGVQTHSDWTPGSSYEASVPGVVDIAAGENVEVDPPRRLVQTFTALWSDEVKAEGTTRVSWEIEPVGSSCRFPWSTTGFPREQTQSSTAAGQ
jgi:uncharacterized protein YndB with AHSA1/START domain